MVLGDAAGAPTKQRASLFNRDQSSPVVVAILRAMRQTLTAALTDAPSPGHWRRIRNDMAELVSCLLQEIEGVAESDGESVASLRERHTQQPAVGDHDVAAVSS